MNQLSLFDEHAERPAATGAVNILCGKNSDGKEVTFISDIAPAGFISASILAVSYRLEGSDLVITRPDGKIVRFAISIWQKSKQLYSLYDSYMSGIDLY